MTYCYAQTSVGHRVRLEDARAVNDPGLLTPCSLLSQSWANVARGNGLVGDAAGAAGRATFPLGPSRGPMLEASPARRLRNRVSDVAAETRVPLGLPRRDRERQDEIVVGTVAPVEGVFRTVPDPL